MVAAPEKLGDIAPDVFFYDELATWMIDDPVLY
jgi:hypothetical protein